MEEKRHHERIKSLLRAQIIFNNRMATVDCVVKNFSRRGAKLALGDALSLPNEFDLDIPQKGRVYRARMTWRQVDSVGVEFIQVEAAAATERPPSGGDRQMRDLETQNAELKARIRMLKKRLEDLGQDPNLAA